MYAAAFIVVTILHRCHTGYYIEMYYDVRCFMVRFFSYINESASWIISVTFIELFPSSTHYPIATVIGTRLSPSEILPKFAIRWSFSWRNLSSIPGVVDINTNSSPPIR